MLQRLQQLDYEWNDDMKKTFATIPLALLTIFSLASCGDRDNDSSDNGSYYEDHDYGYGNSDRDDRDDHDNRDDYDDRRDNDVSDDFSDIGDDVKDTVDDVVDGVEDAGEGIVSGANSAIDDMTDTTDTTAE